jgi:hypothetical protein
VGSVLLTGEAAVARNKWQPLEVVGGSLPIVRQMAQYHPPHSTHLLPLYRSSRHLADQLGVDHWLRHLRAYNKMATAAANIPMDPSSVIFIMGSPAP